MSRWFYVLIALGALGGFILGAGYLTYVIKANPTYAHVGRPLALADGIQVWGFTVAGLGALAGMAAGIAFKFDGGMDLHPNM